MIRQDTHQAEARRSLAGDLLVLFKARIVVLLLLASLGGAFVGAAGWPGWAVLAVVVVAGGLAAMGASALNQYIERGSDGLMNRTRRRPLVAGRIAHPVWVPIVGTLMIAVPVAVTWKWSPAFSAFLALGAFIYVVIYTIWLKPRTSLNIVIGGAAGSCAVLAGGAAAGTTLTVAIGAGWSDPGVLLLALALFFWTPIHFWALALVYREDYARAGVPMLPVTAAPHTAAIWGFLHGLGAGLCALLLALRPGMGWVYLAPVAIITGLLLWQGFSLVVEPVSRRAWRLFHTSNLFLAILLVAAMIASVV